MKNENGYSLDQPGREIADREVSPLTKFQATEVIFDLISGESTLVVAGSVAQQLACHETEGASLLRVNDFSAVHDLDLTTIDQSFEDTKSIQSYLQETIAASGFKLDVSETFYRFIKIPEIRKHGLDWAIVTMEGSNDSYEIQYMTPALLLLSLASMQVGIKTSAEKLQRKIVALQQHPKFSSEDFELLADTELELEYRSNAARFNIWRKNVLKDWYGRRVEHKNDISFHQLIQRAPETGPFLFDEAVLFSLIQTPEDLEQTSYGRVRYISRLERFLREYRLMKRE